MADVIDIIHNLSYTADTSVIEAINKQFGAQFEQLAALVKQLGVYEEALAKMGKDNVQDVKALNVQIDAQKGKISEVTANIGKQFVENEKLTKSFAGTKDKLTGLSTVGLEFAKASLHFGEGMKEGITAIVEKIPDLVEKFKDAKEAGASTKDIITSLGTSIFSLNGLLSLGVEALVLFAEKLFDTSDAAKAAEKRMKEYGENLQGIGDASRKSANDEIATLRALEASATNVHLSTEKRQKATDLMQSMYPSYLSNINDEVIQNGKAAASIDAIVKALEARGRAEAAQKQYAEARDHEVQTAAKEKEAENKLKATQADLDKTTRSSWSLAPDYKKFSAREDAREQLEIYKKEHEQFKANMKHFLAEQQKYAAEAGDLYLGYSPPSAKEKKPPTPPATPPTPPATNKPKSDRDKLQEALDNDKDLQKLIDAQTEINKKYALLDKNDREAGRQLSPEEQKTRQSQRIDELERKELLQEKRIIEIKQKNTKNARELAELQRQQSEIDLKLEEKDPGIATIDTSKANTNPQTGLYDTDLTTKKNKQDLTGFLDDQIKKEKKAAEKRKELQQSIKDGYKSLAETVVQTYNTILEAQQKQLDSEITAQQKRVDDLTAIQDRGNTEQLRQEQERLNELEKKRADSVKRQTELNALMGISNSALALTDAIKGVLAAAANSSEAGAPGYIAAIVAGFAAVAGLYASVKSLGEAEKGYAEGGYTGPGGKWQPAGTVHKGEIVWSQKDIARAGGVSMVERMRTMQQWPILRQRDMSMMQPAADYASKKELNTLNHKMDQLIAATEGNTVRVNQHIDRHGVHQMVETARQMERAKWR